MNKLKLVTIFIVFVLVFTICSAGFVEITKPEQKQKVSWQYVVEGNSSAKSDSGLSIYVLISLISPIASDSPWCIQPTETLPDGGWISSSHFGDDPIQYPESTGGIFRIVAIMTNEKYESGHMLYTLPALPQRSQEVIVVRSSEAYEV